MNIFTPTEWDTSLVLTIVLAPLCVGLMIVIFTQMFATNAAKHEKDSAIRELGKFRENAAAEAQTLKYTIAQRDEEINRQKEEIDRLHKELEAMPALKASLKEQSQLQARIRQLERKNEDVEAQLRIKSIGF